MRRATDCRPAAAVGAARGPAQRVRLHRPALPNVRPVGGDALRRRELRLSARASRGGAVGRGVLPRPLPPSAPHRGRDAAARAAQSGRGAVGEPVPWALAGDGRAADALRGDRPLKTRRPAARGVERGPRRTLRAETRCRAPRSRVQRPRRRAERARDARRPRRAAAHHHRKADAARGRAHPRGARLLVERHGRRGGREPDRSHDRTEARAADPNRP
mmetsp:Transcript_3769/g.11935  ORF Transcript_3769/g.11935 Transcript_3769/m.11935 type:complete len:217 (-) Transcript_3769:46-696(-)